MRALTLTGCRLDRTEPEPRFPFWEHVRAEAGRTWGGRLRFIWMLTAAAGLALLGWVECPGLMATLMATLRPVGGTGAALPVLGEPAFAALCALTCWLPAWLCSDLLATRWAGNPDPLREWSPAELAARAGGRLLPLYAVLTLWIAAYTGRAVAFDLALPSGRGFIGSAGLQISARQAASWWIAWVAVFLISGLFYAAAAALLSATSRRPRRPVIVPIVVIFASLAGLELISLSGPQASLFRETLQKATDASQFTPWVAMPNFWFGYLSAGLVAEHLPAALKPEPVGFDFDQICWMASLAYLLYTLLLVRVIAWMSARRCRRLRTSLKRDKPHPAALQGANCREPTGF
jgi:hypothetical protein